MSDPRDRLIAERMGWLCACGESECDDEPLNLADARDREAVIAWLNAQGLTVEVEYYPEGNAAVEIKSGRKMLSLRLEASIEEAFRAAVLAATEGKEQ